MGGDAVETAVTSLLGLPAEASTFARDIDLLHAFVFSIAFVGSVGVTLLAAVFMARYRRGARRRRRPAGASFAEELCIIGFILSLFLLWWVIGFHEYGEMRTPPAGARVVHVTAKQWMWKFEHDDGTNELGTLTVALGEPVELMMTSRDVIHSFYVPAFRVKEDVIPGRYSTAWFTPNTLGDFPIRCTELCGAGHARMLAVVHVVPAAQLDAALDVDRPEGAAAHRGLAAAARAGCLSCHSLDGEPRIGPSWLALAGSVQTMASGELVLADDAYLTESMMDPSLRVVSNYDDVMPSFRGSLTPEETADIVALIHSLRGPP